MQQDELGRSASLWAPRDEGGDGAVIHGAGGAKEPRGSEVGLVLLDPAERSERTCLLLEDDPVLRRVLTRYLSGRGFMVSAAATVAEAVGLAERARFGLILSDSLLPDGSGVDFCAELGERAGLPAVLVMSGDRRLNRARLEARHPAASFLLKPFSMPALDGAVARVESATRLAYVAQRGVDAERLTRFGERFVPSVPVEASEVERVLSALWALSPGASPVLFRSASEARASEVARLLHDAGPRHDLPIEFVRAAEVDDMDALLARLRDAGSLVLERIELLAPAQQSRLCAFLLDGELEQTDRKGRVRPRVRVLATAQLDLRQRIVERAFVPELWECLRALEVDLDAPGEVHSVG